MTVTPPTSTPWLTGPERTPTLTRFGEIPLYREGLYQVASQSYAWLVPNGSWGETNIGLIDCNGESVLIDTCWDLRFTREMLQCMQGVIKRSPIEYIINTHADGDHCWGNQLFTDKPIIATHACVKQMHHVAPNTLRSLALGGRVLRKLPIAGMDKFGHYMATMFKPYDFTDVRVTPAVQSFSGEKTLNVRGTEIVLTEVGPGHTDGDAIVFVPGQRVVFAGDILFVGVTPVMWSGPVEQLMAGLKKLLSLDTDVIVPGHGPLATQTDVQGVIDYWDFAQEEIHARFQQGMSAPDAARAILLSPAFSNSPFARWNSPERLVTNAYTLYRHWGSQQTHLPGNLGTMEILREQAKLAFELPNATPPCMHHFHT